MNKNYYKLLGLAIAIGFFSWIIVRYHLGMYLSLDGFNRYHAEILDFEQHNMLEFGSLYVGGYILLIALCIPGTILFDLLAGFIYGPVLGTLLVLASYLIGAIVNFLLVRYFLKDLCHRRFFHLREVVMRDGGGFRGAALNLIGLRFIPVIPFWLLNILAAILEIPLTLFVVTTFIGIIPCSIIYVMIGSGVREHLSQNKSISGDILTNPTLWVPLMLLGLLILVPNFIKAYRKRRNKIQL